MSVKHALLGILATAPMHGYDLKRMFDEKLGEFWSLNYGQIYTTLERLQADGLVEFDAVSQNDKPDKKVYRITETGLVEFRDWRRRPLKPEPRALRDELFIRLLFMEADELDAMLALLQSQQSAYLAQMMQLTNRKVDIDQTARRALHGNEDAEARARIERERLLHLTVIDAALFHAEADIRWLRQCEVRIKDLFGKNNRGNV